MEIMRRTVTRVAPTTLDAPPKELLSPPTKDRGGVQSIERAFAILEEVARHRDGIRLGDLSRRVGLHTSTTFHLAKTMVSLGYLSHVRENKTFRIGRPLFTLAASAFDEVELVAIATPILQRLSAETEESSHFAVRSGDDVVMLARVAGSGAFQLADRVGAVRPAHCTALGKILLAALDEDELRAYLARRPPQAFTLKTATDVDRIVREIEAVRRDGIAYDDSEYNAEARCVAVETSPARSKGQSASPVRSGGYPYKRSRKSRDLSATRPNACRANSDSCRPRHLRSQRLRHRCVNERPRPSLRKMARTIQIDTKHTNYDYF
jgi:DNA-binding IclR family transcriptional regulator